MEVVLLKDVENLGDANTLVKVKDGYGRNYLIPNKLAMIANEGNLNMLKERQRQSEKREQKILSQIQGMMDRFKETVIKVGAKVGQSEKIFGSVTNVQLAEAIKKQLGVEIDRKKIQVPDDVKTLGTYTASIHLQKDSKVDVQFEVVEE